MMSAAVLRTRCPQPLSAAAAVRRTRFRPVFRTDYRFL